nr:hypothetical protein P5658_09115 [Bacillus subtilis]
MHQNLGRELQQVSKKYETLSGNTSRAASVFSVFKKDSQEVSKELKAVYDSATETGKALTAIGAVGALGIGATVKAALPALKRK